MLKLSFAALSKEFIFRISARVYKLDIDILFDVTDVISKPALIKLQHQEYGWMLCFLGFIFSVFVMKPESELAQFASKLHSIVPEVNSLNVISQDERAKIFAKAVDVVAASIKKAANDGKRKTIVQLSTEDKEILKAIKDLFEENNYRVYISSFQLEIIW